MEVVVVFVGYLGRLTVRAACGQGKGVGGVLWVSVLKLLFSNKGGEGRGGVGWVYGAVGEKSLWFYRHVGGGHWGCS